MPVVLNSSYTAPFGFSNGHVQTVFPQIRNVQGVVYRRERIETPDDDFLDLDWAENGSSRLAILSHGLEGNTQRPYILGMIRALLKRGWDALAWNYRECSGQPNRNLRWYHSGDTGDLDTVIRHVIARDRYSERILIGFSLGGNVTLKYLGEKGSEARRFVSKAVALSVPCDLKASALKLERRANRIYMIRFLRSLHEKVRAKMHLFPDSIKDTGFEKIRTFTQFDDRYTAPIHGFRDAEDYFAKSSSRQFLPEIRIPALLINAKNDPFLPEPCFPYVEAEGNPCFFFESPESGGHVGFVRLRNNGEYWSETRAVEFLETARPNS